MLKRSQLYLILFYIIFTAVWFISYIYTGVIPNVNIVCNILLIIGIILFGVGWLFEKYTLKECLIQFVFLIFLAFTYFKSGAENEGILTIILAIVGIKNISIKSVTKVMLFTLVILFVVLIVLTLFGVIPYNTYQKIDAFGNTYDTIEIAGKHGNSIYMIIFVIEALYLYTYHNQLNIRKCIGMQIILLIAYFLLYSRTGIILGTFTIWGTLFVRKLQLKNCTIPKVLKYFIENSYLIMFLFVYISGTFFYNTAFGQFLNKLITSRIFEANYYITNSGISLMPKVVQYYICDNSQTYIMVSLGILFTIVYLAVYYKAIKNLLKKNKYIETFFIIVFLIYSYCEVIFIKPFPNFSMLFLIYAFYPNREVDNKNEYKELSNNMSNKHLFWKIT